MEIEIRCRLISHMRYNVYFYSSNVISDCKTDIHTASDYTEITVLEINLNV